MVFGTLISHAFQKYFDLLKLITENWQEFYKIYIPTKTQNFYSVDVSPLLHVKY